MTVDHSAVAGIICRLKLAIVHCDNSSPSDSTIATSVACAGTTDLHTEAHLQFDRLLLTLVLQSTNGNQYQAAKILGIARQTLRNRLRELGLNVTRSVEGGEEN